MKNLIDEVLDEDRIGGSGCFIWNEAGNELREDDGKYFEEVLSRLEGDITLEAARMKKDDDLHKIYPGLSYLLFYLIEVGVPINVERVVSTARNFPPILLQALIYDAARVFDRPDEPSRRLRRCLPLIDFIREMKQSPHKSVRKAARFALRVIVADR